MSVVYISHRLQELLEIGDQFTILRDGRLVATAQPIEVSGTSIVELMNRQAAACRKESSIVNQRSSTVMRVQKLTLQQQGHALLHDVSFQLKRGEILGVYGLLGAGRTELFETVLGQRQETSGEVVLNTQQVFDWRAYRRTDLLRDLSERLFARL